jgi:nitrogenase-associated protein
MTTVIFYEKPGCANNTRQKRLLLAAGHEVVARNLLTELWTRDRLLKFFGDLPVQEWFNRAAPRVKSGEIDPDRLNADAALDLMLAEPILIRRPLMETDGWRTVGFDAKQVDAQLGLGTEGVEDARELDGCARDHVMTPCPAPQDDSSAEREEPVNAQRAAVALAYHERTKHRPERYAAGPETLDWTMQPDPFRTYQGSPVVRLPLCAGRLATPFANVYLPEEVWSPALSLDSVGALLELSLGLSAWKEYGPDRWALRCNPSSGNLHPTEAYVVARDIPGLDSGVYHYASRSHALEQRCRMPFPESTAASSPRSLWIGFSSIHWREAWKYGERAFRYCQLDIGHALAALRYAAGVLGWHVRVVDACDGARLSGLLGLDRAQDFAGAEREEADLLVQIIPQALPHELAGKAAAACAWDGTEATWMGRANVLDPHPMYHWPVIDEVATATEKTVPALDTHGGTRSYPPAPVSSQAPAVNVIRGRRSAQRFDPEFTMATSDFYHLLDSLLARQQTPWDLWDFAPLVHPVLFVHRVEGVTPGLYILIRDKDAEARVRLAMSDELEWLPAEHCPAHIPLFRLRAGRWNKVARAVSCHQAIAADSCFSLGMVAEFANVVKQDPWRYRQLHWEAGLLGHVLYLEAEALALRGTGIGCFLDDAFHELLGLKDNEFQSLYHFTVGRALTDERITTLPPYGEREDSENGSDHHGQ